MVLPAVQIRDLQESDLAQVLDLPTGPLGKVVAQLAQKQWLRRQPSAEDKRLKHLYLSAEAQPMIALTARGYRDLHRELSAHLPAQHLADLEQGLRQLRKALLSLTPYPVTTSPPPPELKLP